MSNSPSVSECRGFKVHPSIIKTLIREQAGSLPRAFAELVMNAVDAGATNIDLTFDENGNFTLRDNGKGFQNRAEIEMFWETFGTPHNDGDAMYGRFRIGRGQIMSFASSAWRSGPFEMRVDLDGAVDSFGYELIEHPDWQNGCSISGTLYRANDYNLSYYFVSLPKTTPLEQADFHNSDSFESIVRFVSVPISINGLQINTPALSYQWEQEDEYAWYELDKANHILSIYNMGILVQEIHADNHGTGGIICSKSPFELNLARNSVIHQCAVWTHIRGVLQANFAKKLERVKRLTQQEALTLLRNLCYKEELFTRTTAQNLRKLRFLRDIFGTFRSPDEFFHNKTFTLYDGVHTSIAEHVQNSDVACVITPHLMHDAGAKCDDDNAIRFIKAICNKLHISKDFYFEPFENYLSCFREIHTLLDDNSLSPDELLTLNILRKVNARIAAITLGKNFKKRKIVAGVADCFDGWTDGVTYIAISRRALSKIRCKSGVTSLLNLMIHEYSHSIDSVSEHDHGFDFYKCFHEAVFQNDYGAIADTMFKEYLAGLVKLNIVPSNYTRPLALRIGKLGYSLPRRGDSITQDQGEIGKN